MLKKIYVVDSDKKINLKGKVKNLSHSYDITKF